MDSSLSPRARDCPLSNRSYRKIEGHAMLQAYVATQTGEAGRRFMGRNIVTQRRQFDEPLRTSDTKLGLLDHIGA